MRLLVVLATLVATTALATGAEAAKLTKVERQAQFYEVSCPTATQCTAISDAGVTTFNPASPGTPSVTPIPHAPYEQASCVNGQPCTFSETPSQPAGGTEVECPTTSLCVAITGPPVGPGAGGFQRYSGNSPTAVTVFDPANPGAAKPALYYHCQDLNGATCRGFGGAFLECPAPGQCTILASPKDPRSTAKDVLTFDPAAPDATATRVPLSYAGTISDIDCASAAQCTGVTWCATGAQFGCSDANTGEQVTFDPRAPGSPVTAKISTFPFVALACPATTQCTGILNTFDNDAGAMATFDPTGAKPPVGLANGVVDGTPNSFEIDCPTARQCTAMSFSIPYGGTFDPTARKKIELGSFSPSLKEKHRAMDVQCPKANFCVAVGGGDGSAPDINDPGVIFTFNPHALTTRAEQRCVAKAKKIKNKRKRKKALKRCRD